MGADPASKDKHLTPNAQEQPTLNTTLSTPGYPDLHNPQTNLEGLLSDIHIITQSFSEDRTTSHVRIQANKLLLWSLAAISYRPQKPKDLQDIASSLSDLPRLMRDYKEEHHALALDILLLKVKSQVGGSVEPSELPTPEQIQNMCESAPIAANVALLMSCRILGDLSQRGSGRSPNDGGLELARQTVALFSQQRPTYLTAVPFKLAVAVRGEFVTFAKKILTLSKTPSEQIAVLSKISRLYQVKHSEQSERTARTCQRYRDACQLLITAYSLDPLTKLDAAALDRLIRPLPPSDGTTPGNTAPTTQDTSESASLLAWMQNLVPALKVSIQDLAEDKRAAADCAAHIDGFIAILKEGRLSMSSSADFREACEPLILELQLIRLIPLAKGNAYNAFMETCAKVAKTHYTNLLNDFAPGFVEATRHLLANDRSTLKKLGALELVSSLPISWSKEQLHILLELCSTCSESFNTNHTAMALARLGTIRDNLLPHAMRVGSLSDLYQSTSGAAVKIFRKTSSENLKLLAGNFLKDTVTVFTEQIIANKFPESKLSSTIIWECSDLLSTPHFPSGWFYRNVELLPRFEQNFELALNNETDPDTRFDLTQAFFALVERFTYAHRRLEKSDEADAIFNRVVEFAEKWRLCSGPLLFLWAHQLSVGEDRNGLLCEAIKRHLAYAKEQEDDPTHDRHLVSLFKNATSFRQSGPSDPEVAKWLIFATLYLKRSAEKNSASSSSPPHYTATTRVTDEDALACFQYTQEYMRRFAPSSEPTEIKLLFSKLSAMFRPPPKRT
jgi:hypothetical protein